MHNCCCHRETEQNPEISSLLSGSFRNPQPLVFSQKYCRYAWEAYCGTIGGVLQYRLEVYCGVSLSSKLRSQQGTALQMGGVVGTNWRCIAVLLDKLYRSGAPKQCPYLMMKRIGAEIWEGGNECRKDAVCVEALTKAFIHSMPPLLSVKGTFLH